MFRFMIRYVVKWVHGHVRRWLVGYVGVWVLWRMCGYMSK